MKRSLEVSIVRTFGNLKEDGECLEVVFVPFTAKETYLRSPWIEHVSTMEIQR